MALIVSLCPAFGCLSKRMLLINPLLCWSYRIKAASLLNVYYFATHTKKHLAIISSIRAGRGGKQPRWAEGGCENRGADYQGKHDLHSSVAVIITVTEPEPSDQTDLWKQVVYKHCQGPDLGPWFVPSLPWLHPAARDTNSAQQFSNWLPAAVKATMPSSSIYFCTLM